MSTDRSTALQEDIQAYLAGRPFFHGAGTQKDIPIVTERIGDIESAIEEQVAKIGICVKVTTPESRNVSKNAPVPVVLPTVVLTVYEDVTINRSGTGSKQPASKVADACAWYLHQSNALGHWLIFSEKVLNRDDAELLAYDVVFEGDKMALSEPTR